MLEDGSRDPFETSIVQMGGFDVVSRSLGCFFTYKQQYLLSLKMVVVLYTFLSTTNNMLSLYKDYCIDIFTSPSPSSYSFFIT